MRSAVALPMLLGLVCAGLAQSADWQKSWDATLAAAKREGKVVVVGSPHPEMRNEVIPRFTARFGIPVDFIAGKSGENVERVRIERGSGIFSADVFMVGASTALTSISTPVLLYSADSRPLSILLLEYSFTGEIERAAALGLLITAIICAMMLIGRRLGLRMTSPSRQEARPTM